MNSINSAVRKFLSEIGTKGGRSRSPAKVRASRRNARRAWAARRRAAR